MFFNLRSFLKNIFQPILIKLLYAKTWRYTSILAIISCRKEPKKNSLVVLTVEITRHYQAYYIFADAACYFLIYLQNIIPYFSWKGICSRPYRREKVGN